jgi:formamidopyrimidine-DNA glycosylase
MPELPEVETVARDLRRHLLPSPSDPRPTIVGARVSWPRTLRHGTGESFGEGVAGRTVEAIGRRGKQLVVDLSGGAFLTIHLKMTGQLFVVPRDRPEDAYLRLVLELADGRDIRFRDIRKFGRVGLYFADDDPFDEVGPEPLDAAFTVREFRSRIRGRRARLKPLLVDQAFVAGVGNIYADEALWRARLHPLRTARTLRPPDERRLYRELRAVLAEAVERRGSSIDDYTAPDGDGEMQERLDVYQRTGEPCRRCGRPIRRIVIGTRSTHFCSFCQRLPAADRVSAASILRTMSPRSGTVSGARSRPLRRAAATRAAAATRRAAARAGAGSP